MFDYADSNKDGKISYQVSLMAVLGCRSYNHTPLLPNTAAFTIQLLNH